MKIVWFLDMV